MLDLPEEKSTAGAVLRIFMRGCIARAAGGELGGLERARTAIRPASGLTEGGWGRRKLPVLNLRYAIALAVEWNIRPMAQLPDRHDTRVCRLLVALTLSCLPADAWRANKWRPCSVYVCRQALQQNNVPYPDHGVEVLYRFANFDPFVRAKYFG
jgi:hypothetical protein